MNQRKKNHNDDMADDEFAFMSDAVVFDLDNTKTPPRTNWNDVQIPKKKERTTFGRQNTQISKRNKVGSNEKSEQPLRRAIDRQNTNLRGIISSEVIGIGTKLELCTAQHIKQKFRQQGATKNSKSKKNLSYHNQFMTVDNDEFANVSHARYGDKGSINFSLKKVNSGKYNNCAIFQYNNKDLCVYIFASFSK